MPHEASQPLAILMAVRAEAKRLLRALSQRTSGQIAGYRTVTGDLFGHPVLVAFSGMGQKHIETFTQALLEKNRPRALVSAGFAGALTTPSRVGDLLVASSLQSFPAPPATPATEALSCTEALVSSAREALQHRSIPHRFGRLATLPRVLPAGAEQRAQLLSLGYEGVDMESATAARAARSSCLPFLCVRALTDTPDDPLRLDYNRMTPAGGSLTPALVLAQVLVRPWKLGALLHDARASSRAAAALLAFFQAWLPRLRQGAPSPPDP